MFVKNHMLKKEQLTTVDLEASIESTIKKMTSGNFLSLPVVSNGELKGLIMKEAIYRGYIEEGKNNVHDYMTLTKVKDIYNNKVQTIQDTDVIENAAYLLSELSIPFLAVLDSNRQFVGILTHFAIFNAFSDILGNNKGSRIVVNMLDIPGQLAKLTELCKEENINIINIAMIDAKIKDYVKVILRVETDNLDNLMIEIKNAGFIIGELENN